jgi:hypothetical protein
MPDPAVRPPLPCVLPLLVFPERRVRATDGSSAGEAEPARGPTTDVVGGGMQPLAAACKTGKLRARGLSTGRGRDIYAVLQYYVRVDRTEYALGHLHRWRIIMHVPTARARVRVPFHRWSSHDDVECAQGDPC